MKEKVNILGVEIENTTMEEARLKVEGFLKAENMSVIYTPNTEIVMEAKRDKKLRDILNEGSLVVPDGIGLIYASKIKKKPLKERVAGFDLSVEILDIADKNGYSIYLLGGEEGIAKKAGEEIKKRYPGARIAGYHNGYFKGAHIGKPGHSEEDEVISDINKSRADILFVGFGAPRQEFWIKENKERLSVKLVIGNGGTMDVLAGKAKRAPEIYQKLGLEWFYRLMKDPRRIKRQISLPIFMLTVIFNRGSVK
jgi:N-acetylglucosaminyldiphosphoundecaprenol N-acetyl-beta-D-mannosaminyltransferase